MVAQSAIIYQDDFSGLAANTLHGTTPDVGANSWIGGAGFKADGSVGAGQITSMTVAFTPTNGTAYQLDARVDATATDGNWVGFGFANGQSTASGAANRFTSGDTVGKAWAIVKGVPAVAPNGNTAHGNAAGEGVQFSGTSPSGLDWKLETAEMDLRIVLNTLNPTWTATWYAKRATDSDYALVRDTTPLSAQNITSVGLVAGGGSGVFSYFSLSDSATVTTNPPPPPPPLLIGLNKTPPILQIGSSNQLLHVSAAFSDTNNFPQLLQYAPDIVDNTWSNLDVAFASNKTWRIDDGATKGFFKTKPTPNIVYVFADQMRADALGALGNTQVITPELDRLATEGILLTDAISAQPVCTPYRAHLLTGRYGHTTGVYHNDLRLPDTELLLPTILKANGYATGYIGKWHLSGNRLDPVDAVSRRDWDYWAVRNVSHDHDNVKYWVNDSTTAITVPGAWEPTVQTDLAIDFINNHTNRPFCLMISMGPPHDPYAAPSEYVAMYNGVTIAPRPNVPAAYFKANQIKQYYAMITSIDENMGRLDQAIKDAGIADDTLFIFTSDHGDMHGSLGQILKQRPWEESINIPFIIRYPRSIKAGQTRDWLFSSVDVMPTLLSFCEIDIPANVQGVNYAPTMMGLSDAERDAAFLFNVAIGTNGSHVDWRGIRTKDWIYAYHNTGDWVMYDLNTDPYQLNNLVDNPAFAAQKATLKTQLDAMRTDLGDTMPLGGTVPDPIILP